MLKVSREVLQTKIDWFDPYMRGPVIKSTENIKEGVRILYTEEEKKEISEEAQQYFLASDEDLEALKLKAAHYGRDLDPVPIDGDCLLHAIRKQCKINTHWTLQQNRETLAFYMAKLPEQFILYAHPYTMKQRYESYILNFWNGDSYGDELIAAVWGHIWNLKITILMPGAPDLKCFHDDDEFPDVVLCHNGRPEPDGHYFATSEYMDFMLLLVLRRFVSF